MGGKERGTGREGSGYELAMIIISHLQPLMSLPQNVISGR